MLLFQTVLDPNSGKTLLIEVEGSDYQDARRKLLLRLDDLTRNGGDATAGAPGATRRTSLVRFVQGSTVGASDLPPCACCFRTV